MSKTTTNDVLLIILLILVVIMLLLQIVQSYRLNQVIHFVLPDSEPTPAARFGVLLEPTSSSKSKKN